MSIDTIEVSKHVDLLACARIAHVLMIGATSAPVAVIQCDIIFLASFLPHCLGHSWEQNCAKVLVSLRPKINWSKLQVVLKVPIGSELFRIGKFTKKK